MMKKILFFLLLLLSLNSIAQTPQRIISLVPSITKELILLELEDELVGITNYCFIPNQENYAIVASAVDVNIERVIALKPDLVFASSLNKPETLNILRKAGLNVVYLDLPRSYPEINAQFLAVGKMCDREEKAKKIIQNQKNKVEQLLAKITSVRQPRIFFEIGSNPLWCVIPNTFMNDFISMSGGKNIVHDLTNGAVSRESVLLRDPEIIIIAAMGNVGEEEVEIWKSYSSLSAAKNELILVLDADKACSPTPVHFVETLEEIINFIYK